MRQYTDKDQTAKLIELGFPKPQGWSNKDISNGMSIALYNDGREDFNYSVGELIEFLPIVINWTPRVIMGNVIEYSFTTEGSELYYCNQNNELIDNLFDMCIRLKEEGVI